MNVANKNKSLIILIAALSVVAICVGLLLIPNLFRTETREGYAKAPDASAKQKGRNYKAVMSDFEERGFTNITTETIEALVFGWLTKDGEVEYVSVDGDTDYRSGEWYPVTAEVVVTYHTFPKLHGSVDDDETDAPVSTAERATAQTQTTAPPTTVPPTTVPPTTAEPATEAPTEEPKPAVKDVPLDELPFGVPDGYSRLQAFYLQITKDYDIDGLKEFADDCGLYCYKYDGGAGYTDLQIAENPYVEITYSSEYFKFDCDCIWVTFDNDGTKMNHAEYSFYKPKGSGIRVQMTAFGQKYVDGVGVVDDDAYYQVQNDANKSDRYYDAKEAMDEAIALFERRYD